MMRCKLYLYIYIHIFELIDISTDIELNHISISNLILLVHVSQVFQIPSYLTTYSWTDYYSSYTWGDSLTCSPPFHIDQPVGMGRPHRFCHKPRKPRCGSSPPSNFAEGIWCIFTYPTGEPDRHAMFNSKIRLSKGYEKKPSRPTLSPLNPGWFSFQDLL